MKTGERRDERKDDDFVEKCQRTLQIRQMNQLNMFRIKTLSDEFFLRKFRILPCFQLFTCFEFEFSVRGNQFRMSFRRNSKRKSSQDTFSDRDGISSFRENANLS